MRISVVSKIGSPAMFSRINPHSLTVEKLNSSEVIRNSVQKLLPLEPSKYHLTKDSDSSSSSTKSTPGMTNGCNSGLMARMSIKNNLDSVLPDKLNCVVHHKIPG